ncbi:MAG: serine hydrolase domain-containing protein, partial [Pseudomonadota bacterium]
MSQLTDVTDEPLARVTPEDVGLSTGRLARIGTSLLREVGEGRIPGAVVGIAHGGQLAYLEGVGYRDPVSKAPMMPDAIFSIASMTKPMVSVAAMQLAEEGLLLLGDPVANYLPELADLKVLVEPTGGRDETREPARQPTVQD